MPSGGEREKSDPPERSDEDVDDLAPTSFRPVDSDAVAIPLVVRVADGSSRGTPPGGARVAAMSSEARERETARATPPQPARSAPSQGGATPPQGARRPVRRPPSSVIATEADARIYDQYVVPRYAAVFGAMLLRAFVAPSRPAVLDAACATGYPSLEILRRADEHARVVAIDRSAALVELASRKALDAAGRRIFFRRGSLDELRFGDQVFDAVVMNLGLLETPDPARFLRECFRVIAPGGQLVATMPLAGTFQEILDLLGEVALKHDLAAVSDRVAALAERYPTAAAAAAMLEAAGFERVGVAVDPFTLPFRSATEIFRDPVVRLVALDEWRWAAGSDEEGERLLGMVERALETYFAGPFVLTVHAACAVGWRAAS
ncbi:MAG: methyltransferase domain-containing protein [Deltaproteobacteria bacterium]|nr:methyltransferase domain-containing protein [Deltaproteobacteria bacterium]